MVLFWGNKRSVFFFLWDLGFSDSDQHEVLGFLDLEDGVFYSVLASTRVDRKTFFNFLFFYPM